MAPFPVDNPTVSFWRSNPHVLDDYRSTPELPTTADIAVIGAGYAGVSTLYHLLQSCKARSVALPSIVLLEARQACSGATGRNGGHLKPDPYNRPSAIAATHGVEAAAEVAKFEADHIAAVKKVVEDEGIDCDFVLTRCTDTFLTHDLYLRMKAGIQLLKQNNVPEAESVFCAEGAEAEQFSGVNGAKGCVTYTTGHLFPYKFVMGLLSKILGSGVNLQTHTPVTEVSETTDSEGYVAVATTRGKIRARKVVYATNAYTAALLPEFEGKIIPVRGICSHIVPARKPAPPLSNSYIIRQGALEYDYLIPRLDGSIVVGGARSKYFHDKEGWYGNVEDDKLIEGAKAHFDGYMQRTFRGWEETGASTSEVWTGIMGYSTDGLPYVGAVPRRENQWMVAGFNGHGMPQAFLSSRGLASMVLEGESFENAGIPKVFEVTQQRLRNSRNAVMESWEAMQGAGGKS